LPIADYLSKKTQQTGPHFSIKRIERLRLAATNPLPQFALLSQIPVSMLLFGLGRQKVHHKSKLSDSSICLKGRFASKSSYDTHGQDKW
jgi:hypothetical protein